MIEDWTSFTLKIAIKTTMQEIYNAWTVGEKIETWFLEKCIFSKNDEPIEKTKSTTNATDYEWRWFLYDEVEKGTYTQANGKDFVQFSFAENCLVDIALLQIDENVIVQLTQHNIPTDEASKFRIRIGCLEGWTFYLANLKSVYENGYDLRNKNPDLKGFNN